MQMQTMSGSRDSLGTLPRWAVSTGLRTDIIKSTIHQRMDAMGSVIEARCCCEHCGLERFEVRDWLGHGPPSTSARHLQWSGHFFLSSTALSQCSKRSIRDNPSWRLCRMWALTSGTKALFLRKMKVPLNRYLLFLFYFNAFLYGSCIWPWQYLRGRRWGRKPEWNLIESLFPKEKKKNCWRCGNFHSWEHLLVWEKAEWRKEMQTDPDVSLEVRL